MITRRIVLGGAVALIAGCNDKKPQPPWVPPVPVPPSHPPYHINPIINGQRYQPPAGLPEWSNGDIEFPVGEQVGTIMREAAGPFPPEGKMSIDYELSDSIDQMVGSVDHTNYISAGLWFIRRGDQYWSGMPPLEHKTRWYSKTELPVIAGRHQASVTLTFEAWGGATVLGAPELTPADFAEALADPEWYGMVLGDRSGRAHSWEAPVPGIKLIIRLLEVTP